MKPYLALILFAVVVVALVVLAADSFSAEKPTALTKDEKYSVVMSNNALTQATAVVQASPEYQKWRKDEDLMIALEPFKKYTAAKAEYDKAVEAILKTRGIKVEEYPNYALCNGPGTGACASVAAGDVQLVLVKK